MSYQLNFMDVKDIKVDMDRKLSVGLDQREFTTTTIIANTKEGVVQVVMFGPKEGIPISISKAKEDVETPGSN